MSFNFVLDPRGCELVEHCRFNQFPCQIYSEPDYPADSYYLIGVSFFDFTLDWFADIGDRILDDLRQGRIRALFYYHEGDNPWEIKKRLDLLCEQHQLPVDSYRFVSGNTEADSIAGFAWFPDHELLYQRRNNSVPACGVHSDLRTKDFTMLSRTHKWWRVSIMTEFHRRGLLNNSYWSYRCDLNLGETDYDNPIQIERWPGLRPLIDLFVAGAPYSCDSLTIDEHNNHTLLEAEHFINAYYNIVLETYYNIENTGTFLTEKTFKPIKHGQPFIIAGPPNTLTALRSLGYRTFDNLIDNSYDTETHDSFRLMKILNSVEQLQNKDLHQWYLDCQADILHNQQLFLAPKTDRLNTLLEKLK